MEEESVVNEIKDEDVVSDEHIVEYDVSEIGNVLAEIRGIENAIDSLKKSITSIDNSIKNSRLILHQIEDDKELP
jgi:prefoldin subunit 5